MNYTHDRFVTEAKEFAQQMSGSDDFDVSFVTIQPEQSGDEITLTDLLPQEDQSYLQLTGVIDDNKRLQIHIFFSNTVDLPEFYFEVQGMANPTELLLENDFVHKKRHPIKNTFWWCVH